jgi:CRP/FNR family transcriptional activator FtrB
MTFMRIGEKPEIARLPLFRDMDDAMRERVLSGSFLQVFPPQLTLFEIGQRADFLHVLVDGLVELYAAGDVRDTTMRIVEPVTSYILAAVINDMPYLMSARTLASSRILLVPAALMREVIKRDTALMQATMHELALGYRARHGGKQEFELSGEKRVLASLLGMTPENLSRAFGTLKAHGVTARGAKIRIEDRAALSAFSRPDPVPPDQR